MTTSRNLPVLDIDRAIISPVDFDEWRSRQERLRDSVEDIQKQLQEKRKPWYRNLVTVMSIAGTLFAVSSGLYSIHSSRSEQVDKNASALQSIVEQLIQLRTDENQDLATAKNDFQNFAIRSSLRNTKRISLLDEAATKVRAASLEVSPSMLIVLASETAANGDYKTAFKYLELANERSASGSPTKVSALYNQAVLCLTDGKALCKLGEGKDLYLAALKEQPADSDNTHYQRAQLLVNIALLLRSVPGASGELQQYMSQAKSEAARISPINPLRKQVEQYISVGRSLVDTTASQGDLASFSTPDKFVGKWALSFPEDASKVGSATFVQLPAFPFYGAYVDVLDNGKLTEKQQGQVEVVDARTARFDWTSIGLGGQTAGYSKLVFMPDGNTIVVDQFRLGDSKVVAILRRKSQMAESSFGQEAKGQ